MDWIVIMAGGGGTRLWPLSRRRRPKQFLDLLPGGESLLGATVRRLGGLVPPERIVVVTAASQVPEVRRTAPSLPAENIVVEPEGRNTAACIGLAAVEVRRRDPDAVLGVIPSDQFVADEPGFRAALALALDAARTGHVVTVGIPPTRPETGFGYIEREDDDDGEPGHRRSSGVVRFVEKPDLETARGYLASGRFLWNAGMFFFPAGRILDEIRALVPALADVLDEIAADPSRTEAVYRQAPKISIDYAVMEKLPGRGGMRVVPGDFGWNDVGSWDALADVLPQDRDGNTTLGETVTIDSRGNILVGGEGLVVTCVGVSDLIVVATADGVLVLPRDRAQDVKKIVEALEKRGRIERL